MQAPLDLSTGWAKKDSRKWKVNTSTVIRPEVTTNTKNVLIANDPVENRTEAQYHGVTVTSAGTNAGKRIYVVRKAARMVYVLNAEGPHYGEISSDTLIRISKNFLLPNAAYGIHLVKLTPVLQSEWEDLEKMTLVNVLGCCLHRTK